METEKQISVLNNLVEINNDRLDGYETASSETEEQDLKTLFAQLALTSTRCKAELVAEIKKLGGVPTEGTKITGKFFRAWMEVKSAITNKDRKSVLNSCEFGEDQALATYAHELKANGSELTEEQLAMISAHQEWLRTDHDQVKSLRDAVSQHA